VSWYADPRVTWSVQVTDASTDEVLLEHDADTVLPTASVAKVLLLMEVSARIEAGVLHEDQPLDRRVTERVHDSGLWHRMSTDVLPLGDVALLVASVSDNWATNVLALEVGLPASGLLDLVRDVRRPEHPPVVSLGNASAWTTVMARLHRRESPGAERVAQWLASGVDHSLVLSAFGRDPLQHDPGALNKTGADPGVRADVGLVGGLAYAAVASCAPGHEAMAVEGLRALGAHLRGIVAG
jgi:beta-lactamase class A